MIPVITRPSKEEIEKYSRAREVCREMEIPCFEAHVAAKVFNPKGELVSDHLQHGHSFTRNFYNLLLSATSFVNGSDNTFAAGKISTKNNGGSVQYGNYPIADTYSHLTNYEADGGGAYGAAADTTIGIVAGTGTNTESFEDYALQTLVANGTSSGQLAYGDTSLSKVYTAGTKLWTITWSRYLNNNSGGTITVTETGLNAMFDAYAGGKGMLSRDILGTPQAVATAGQLLIQYILSLVFPG